MSNLGVFGLSLLGLMIGGTLMAVSTEPNSPDPIERLMAGDFLVSNRQLGIPV